MGKYTLIAAVETELAQLSARDYRRIVRKFPKMMTRHVDVDTAVQTGEIEFEQLDYIYCISQARDSASAKNGIFSRRKSVVMGAGSEDVLRVLSRMTMTGA